MRVEDVNRAIQSGSAQYDAILLDVDMGQGLTRRANDRLYDIWGLKPDLPCAKVGWHPGCMVWGA